MDVVSGFFSKNVGREMGGSWVQAELFREEWACSDGCEIRSLVQRFQR